MNELSVRLLPTQAARSSGGGAIASVREVVERLERMRLECDHLSLLPPSREERERERERAAQGGARKGGAPRLSLRRDSGSSTDGAAAAAAHREHDSGR